MYWRRQAEVSERSHEMKAERSLDLNSGREEEFLTLVFSAFHRSGARFENDIG